MGHPVHVLKLWWTMLMMIHETYKQIAAAFMVSYVLYLLYQGWQSVHLNTTHSHSRQEDNGLGSGILKRMAEFYLWNKYQYGTHTNVEQNDLLEMSNSKQEENSFGSGMFKRLADDFLNRYQDYQDGTISNIQSNDLLDINLDQGFSQTYDPNSEIIPGDFLHLFAKVPGSFQPKLHCQGNDYYPTIFGNICITSR